MQDVLAPSTDKSSQHFIDDVKGALLFIERHTGERVNRV